MLLSKSVKCPTCGRKVKKTDLIHVETAIKTKVYCCPECIKYLNVRREINDDKGLFPSKGEKTDSQSAGIGNVYKSQLKAKNIDILRRSEEKNELPDERDIEKQALEEQKTQNELAKELSENNEEIKREEPEDFKPEEKKIEESFIPKITGLEKKEDEEVEEIKEKINSSLRRIQNKDEERPEIENLVDKKIDEKEKTELTSEYLSDLNEKKQIVGSDSDVEKISAAIEKKQKEREFKVTASDWMVTSDPMIDKISSAIERRQKERVQKGLIKINGSKVVKNVGSKKVESERAVQDINKDVAEEQKRDKTIEEKVDEKIDVVSEKPSETSGTIVKKILKVRCPTCNKEFTIEKRSGMVHIKCPSCGEEGNVEL